MIVHHSHRIEDLVAELAGVVSQPAGPAADAPLRSEVISVQGRGMERWLSMELSRRLGVWANSQFPFPRSLIESAFDSVLGDPERARGEGGQKRAEGASIAFEPETLIWTVARLLPGLLGEPAFAALASFLRDDTSGDRLLQLAAHVADLLDRYVIYRPGLVVRWEQGGEPEDWQATLWRALVRDRGPHHFARRARQLIAALESGPPPPGALPARVSLFGVTTLPPLYLDVLHALGRHVELHLFVLQCAGSAQVAEQSPLWNSLGSVGQDFQQVLDRAGVERRAAGSASEPEGAGALPLLGAVQESLRRGVSGSTAILDDSIAVHSCHSPMREVEVLHDQLAALFEADPSLEPRDVVVMTPDIGRYAPLIEAVFSASGRSPGERPRIPYRVADQSLRTTHEVVEAFWKCLDVLSGRLTASAVVDLLLAERVRRRFEIAVGDLDTLLAWIREAGIRWGIDAAHREELGQPPEMQNTWRLGLDRLLLGLAMEMRGHPSTYRGVLPVSEVDPADAALLGRFSAFCEALFENRLRPDLARTLPAWRDRLVALLDDLVDDTDDGASQHGALREALESLVERAEAAGFSGAVPLSAVRRLLEARLERGGPSHGFLAGGVTFCELVPMRSIPFRVTALLGMNDGEFPRSREPLGFDRLAQAPQPGDRSRREDDRYLFLEALVSTREKLLISYVGRSLQDGEARSPAVVVDELLDELVRLTGNDPDAVREHLVTAHPLHPFSPSYFDGASPRLFSFSGSDGRGARALAGAQTRALVAGPFVTAPLPQPDGEARTVSVAELARFFEHPVRAFLQRRLGLYLREEALEIQDREPLELDALERWQVGDRLLHDLAAGIPAAAVLDALSASGGLPTGAPGEVVSLEQLARAEELAAVVRRLRGTEEAPSRSVDLTLDGWRIAGEVGELSGCGRVDFQMSKLPHQRELGFWLRHLVLCASGEGGVPSCSFLVGPNEAKGVSVIELSPHAAAEGCLSDLLELYRLGQEVPLPLFPNASRIQATRRFDEDPDALEWEPEPVPAARSAWEQGGGPRPPDRLDPFLLQAFRDVDPLDPGARLPGGESFGALAHKVYLPYLRARRVRQ